MTAITTSTLHPNNFKRSNLNIVNNSKKRINYNKQNFKRDKLKNDIFAKMYSINNDCHASKITFSKLAGFNVFVECMNTELNSRFNHLFDMHELNVNKFADIVLLQINVAFLQQYFSKSGYDDHDEVDFYNFLIIINDILNEIDDITEKDV